MRGGRGPTQLHRAPLLPRLRVTVRVGARGRVRVRARVRVTVDPGSPELDKLG